MKRNIIKINEELCNGCGACVNGCHEGALQMIDGKARIVSELYCDGLGACIGDCPVGAISIIEKEAEAYDEIAVMDRISPKGEETILAHLKHLRDHNEMEYFNKGVQYVREKGLDINLSSLEENKVIEENKPKFACGCPGSMERSFAAPLSSAVSEIKSESQLTHWPVQLHLLNPNATYFVNADVVLAADCTAYAYANFHSELLKGKKLAIACPKLDSNKEAYVEKLSMMIDSAKINTLTVVIMEVPCCSGLLHLVQTAVSNAERRIPVKLIIIGTQGDIVKDEWI